MRTHCQSCRAPVDLHAEKCAYCGTPYPWKWAAPESVTIELDVAKLHESVNHMMASGLITANEARRRLGLGVMP